MPADYAQWDYQLGTFRAEVGGVVYGTYTGEFTTAAALLAAAGLPPEMADELEAQKVAADARAAEEAAQQEAQDG